MATTQKEKNGKTFTGRARKAGQDESKSGFRTKTEALTWARKREGEMAKSRGERGLGPTRTVTADALLQNGLETLPFKKGAIQEANRLNNVLRLAGRPTVVVTRCAPAPAPADTPAQGDQKRRAQVKFFDVKVQAPTTERNIVPSLAPHRGRLAADSAASDKVLKRLALMKVADVTTADLDDLVLARKHEGKGASTLRHDVHVFRSMINRVRKAWNWSTLDRIPDGDLDLPALPEGRKVVCTPKQEEALAAAMASSYNPKAVPATAMLIETGMRFSECMETARVCDIDWEARCIRLSQAKAGAREVPLNENALAVLRAMDLGQPHEPIFGLSYEAYKKIFERACQRAGIQGVNVHDLRHTAATRAARRLGGDIFLLQAVTGHKTLSQLQRYVHVDAQDVVQAFDATAAHTPASALAQASRQQGSVTAKYLRSQAQLRRRAEGTGQSAQQAGQCIEMAVPAVTASTGAAQPAVREAAPSARASERAQEWRD